MQIDKALETIKDSANGCSLVAFGDLKTRLVLRSLSEEHHAQEHLNQICTQASRSFRSADALAHSVSGERSAHDHAMIVTPDVCQVFVRSSHNDTDVLCCSCVDLSSADELIEQARKMFHMMTVQN